MVTLWTRPIADRAVYAFNAMLLPSLGSIVMTPDVPNVFFWGASLWSLAELRSSRNRMWWLVIGLAVAAVHGTPRMGPAFGSMLLSGRYGAELIKEKLKQE